MQIDLLNGDCLKRLSGLQENSVDSIVTDPPYELGFMGKGWDKTGIANNVELWSECLRVLKPGGHLLAFSGTRTYHRMASAIEDAGFEVRDMIEWVYGSGFPKSLNIGKAVDKLQGNEREVIGDKITGKALQKTSKTGEFADGKHGGQQTITETKGTSEWEGWGTALKPAHEPICMARKPLSEKTVAENCLKWGTGGINIDVSRVSTYAYKDGGSNESIVPSHKLSELRGKLYTLLSSCVADKTDFPPFPNDGEYALRWKELSDFLCGCQFCRDLYDGLLPLFQEGDQVSFQQLHDVQDDIFRLHKEPSNNHGVCIFRPSTEDVLSQLKSYSNDTKLDIQSQGRFPANLLHDNSEEVRECFPETNSKWGKSSGVDVDPDQCSSFKIGLDGQGIKERTNKFTGDSGNASRFFKGIPQVVDLYDFSIYNRSILTNIKQLCGQHLTKKKTDITLDGVIQEVEKFIQDAELLMSGNSTTIEKFLTDTASITKTLIAQMTELKTLNVLPNWLITKFTEESEQTIKSLRELTTEDVKSAKSIFLLQTFTSEVLESIRDIVKIVVEQDSNSGEYKSLLYQAKASKSERNKGCEELEDRVVAFGNKNGDGLGRGISNTRQDLPTKNNHPTVKPIALMEYLIKMVTPKGGIVLDPFMGSGSTGVAAKRSGYGFIGIELDKDYFEIASHRIA